MRVAIDLTNSPHVPLLAPIVRLLEHDGHEVVVTVRDFAQTVELAGIHGLEIAVVGKHGGASRVGKGRAAATRSTALFRHLRRSHRKHPFDVAISHGSTDLPVACRLLGVPHVTMFDYEWARTQHRLNCRLSWRVVTPDAIDPSRLDQYDVVGKLAQYPGLKEEYYLEPACFDPEIRSQLGVDEASTLIVMRPPPELALYHRGHTNTVFADVLDRIAASDTAHAVVLSRTNEQRAALAERFGSANNIELPGHAIDAASLVAASDVVVSAGGTMNREAAALGVPVYTVFAGRMGAVDERLIADGRLRQLDRADNVELVTREDRSWDQTAGFLREPAALLEVLVGGVPVRA
jgi:predicted glycosyltransferase